jgi:acetate kinase
MDLATLNVLTVNCGSSSLKASFFSDNGERQDFRYPHISNDDSHGFEKSIKQLLKDLGNNTPSVIGHRFVHGGDVPDSAKVVDDVEHQRLESIIHLAPLHLPSNLLALDLCKTYFNVPQIACFDTAFHYTMPALSKCLPIPKAFNIHRFGFHGLNYAYIAQILPKVIGDIAYKKVVVAHLGSGASLCLMVNLKSVDTTMGYTPAGGIPMGTRSGDLDPGVMLALAEHNNPQQLRDLVFHHMGLLALSDGESAEMENLLASESNHAKFAVDYFCQQVRGAIGALASKVGGIDALVFSAGIGENSAIIRTKICTPLLFLGIKLNDDLNQSSAIRIEHDESKPIAIIPADEEMMICDLCKTYINNREKN